MKKETSLDRVQQERRQKNASDNKGGKKSLIRLLSTFCLGEGRRGGVRNPNTRAQSPHLNRAITHTRMGTLWGGGGDQIGRERSLIEGSQSMGGVRPGGSRE